MTRRGEEVPFTVTADFDPTPRPRGRRCAHRARTWPFAGNSDPVGLAHEIPRLAPFGGRCTATVVIRGGR